MDRERAPIKRGFSHRPRSIVHGLISISFVIAFLTACSSRPPTVTLAFLGDVNLGRGVTPSSASLSYLAPELRAADLALANLESPLSPAPPSEGTGYNLCTFSSRARFLSGWGLDLLSLANNHDLDCGADGLSQTTSALAAAGLTALLPGFTPSYINIHGLRLAFLAIDDVSSPLDADAADAAIRTAAGFGAQVIVGVHWGEEYQGGADERQQFLANRFVEAGAALVWGTHPHVLQPAGWIVPSFSDANNPSSAAGSERRPPLPLRGPMGRENSRQARKALVLYSLGNALFDQEGLADTRRSALVLVQVDISGVQSARAVPFVIDVRHSQAVEPDAETAAKILDRANLP